MLAYLSGAIEYSPDRGLGWRLQLAPFLRSLGHEVYDPAQDEKKNLSEEEAREFRGWKTADPARFRAAVRKIIAWDLDWIENKCDYVVCFWDEAAGRGAGTQGELTLAHRRGIPVYLVLGMPLAQVSGWILACATEIFPGMEELERFLTARYGSPAPPTRPDREPPARGDSVVISTASGGIMPMADSRRPRAKP